MRTQKQAVALVQPLYLDKGMTPIAIAKKLSGKVSYDEVIQITSNLRRNARRASSVGRAGGVLDRTLNISISTEIYDALAPHAERRGLSVSRLAARIVDASVDCIDAILDEPKADQPVMRVPKTASGPSAPVSPRATHEAVSREVACDSHLEDLRGSGLPRWPDTAPSGRRRSVVRKVFAAAPLGSYSGSAAGMCADSAG